MEEDEALDGFDKIYFVLAAKWLVAAVSAVVAAGSEVPGIQ